MTTPDRSNDAVLAACDAMLREVGGFLLSAERLAEAGPVIEGIVKAIRTMDELDVSQVEPAFSFKVED